MEERYQESRSLWIAIGSRESKASGVAGDAEREPVAVADDDEDMMKGRWG